MKYVGILYFIFLSSTSLNAQSSTPADPENSSSTPAPAVKNEKAATEEIDRQPAAAETETLDFTKQTNEEQIQAEYDAYVEKKREQDEEDHLRQSIFHENAANHISFDVSLQDMSKYDYGTTITDRGSDSYGFNVGYQRFLLRTRNFGRAGLGLEGGIIGSSNRKLHFRTAFYHLGPRISYELKFFTAQVFVPVIFIGYDHIFNQVHSTTPGVSANFDTFIYGGGLYLNLNRVDPHSGTQALVATGVRKFDLALLYQSREGNTPSRSSIFYSAGFRFEY